MVRSVKGIKMRKQNFLLAATLTLTLGAGVTGCASSKVTKLTEAAPITYKIGKGGAAQFASLPTKPKARRNFGTPYTPAPRAAMPTPQAPKTFDQAGVDKQLYKHQRVGKRYTIMGKSYKPKHEPNYNKVGIASYYGDKFHGKPTATGEIFNKNDLTAAHKTLPLNSMLFVTNLENGKTLMVRLNDRGPFVGKRIIDLSEASARALGISANQGLSKVRVQYAGPADPMAGQSVPYPKENYVQAPLTTPAPRIDVPTAPQETAPIPAPIEPRAAERAQPEAPTPEVGGDVTLTIKGPIHTARHDSVQNEARFIPALHKASK